MIKCDFRKNKHGGGRSSSAGCTCVCLVLNRKTKKENKTVDEVMAEKTESAGLNIIHFTERAVGHASRSACSHWLLRVSAQYSIAVPFTPQNLTTTI